MKFPSHLNCDGKLLVKWAPGQQWPRECLVVWTNVAPRLLTSIRRQFLRKPKIWWKGLFKINSTKIHSKNVILSFIFGVTSLNELIIGLQIFSDHCFPQLTKLPHLYILICTIFCQLKYVSVVYICDIYMWYKYIIYIHIWKDDDILRLWISQLRPGDALSTGP